MTSIATFALVIFLYSLASRRLEQTMVTPRDASNMPFEFLQGCPRQGANIGADGMIDHRQQEIR